MQVGDLVKLSWERPTNIGIIIERYYKEYAPGGGYTEWRVQWLNGNDASWVMPNDLEVVSESR